MVVVDDDVEMRLLVGAMLRIRLGAEVVGEGENGEEAIKLAAALQPDLVVLDHVMPVRLGGDAVPEIREVSPETRIVMFSATTSSAELRADGHEPDRFVSKADGLVGLRTAVEDCLADRGGAVAGDATPQPS